MSSFGFGPVHGNASAKGHASHAVAKTSAKSGVKASSMAPAAAIHAIPKESVKTPASKLAGVTAAKYARGMAYAKAHGMSEA